MISAIDIRLDDIDISISQMTHRASTQSLSNSINQIDRQWIMSELQLYTAI